MILNGAGIQDISFDAASALDSHFQTLEINKPVSALTKALSDDGEILSNNFTTSGTWGIGTAAYDGQGAWSDSPAGNYADNSDTALTSKTMNLTNALGAYLSFFHRYDVQANYDFCKVEVSTNNGVAWTEVASFTGKQDAWAAKFIDLSAYAGQASFQVRFRLKSDVTLNADGWNIDLIRLYTVTGSPIRVTGNIYTAGQWTFAADSVIMSTSALTLSDTSLNPAGRTIAAPLDLTISGSTDLNGGTLVTAGSLTLNAPLVMSGGSLSVGKDMTVSSAFDLEGKTLTVPGNLTISSLFYVNGGHCLVGGNLTVSSTNNSYLKMVNTADVVEVGGKANFSGNNTYGVDSAQQPYAYLSAGTLKVKGDFTQGWQGASFRASGTHKVILNGTAKQAINFSSPTTSYFQNLEIANISAAGVAFTSPLTVAGTFMYAPTATLAFNQVSSFGLTLTHDQTITGDLTVNGPLDLAGYALTVTGSLTLNAPLVLSGGSLSVGKDMTVSSAFDLEGKTLTVPGNLTISGLFYVNGSHCLVGGDLTVSSTNNSYLKMVNTTDVVEVGGKANFSGNNTYGVDSAQQPYAYLSAGTLKVKGDFTQSWQGASFRASGTHKVILNGTAKQTINFNSPTTSYFQSLEIANISAAGVAFTSPLTVAGTFIYAPTATLAFNQVSSFGLTLTHDQTITGDLTVNGPLDLAGYALTVTGSLTLNAPLVLSGGSLSVGKDMTVSSAFDLEGKTLTVPGNLTIAALFYVNGSHCLVGGDLTVSSTNNSYLKMVNTADVVEVGGKANFSGNNTYGVDSAQQPYAYLSAGTLKVKGDFTQSWQGASFRASGTHKVILNGTAKQTINFNSPTTSYFQSLEIANISAAGVAFTSPLTVAGTFIYAPTATLAFNQVSSFGLTLTHDQTITGDFTVNGPLDLAGYALTVTGSLTLNFPLVLHGGSLSVGKDMTVSSAFDLEGKTLTVPGNLTISTNGIFSVNGGHCIVGGDLSVSGKAYLKMMNAADVVEVAGKATFNGYDTYGVDSAQNPYAYLSAGTLKVKGDLSQSSYAAGFRASGTHKVILNGTAKQTINFSYPTTSYFQNLEIANISAAGVAFTSPLTVAGTFIYAPTATLAFNQFSSFGLTLIHDQTIIGDLIVNGPLDLAGYALTVTGSLTLNFPLVLHGGSLSVGKDMTVSSAFDLEGKVLTIPGKLTIGTNGILYVNGGHCIVGGDLSVSYGAGYLKMVNAADVVEVGGKAYFAGVDTYGVDNAQNAYAYLSAGTLEVKGDFTQSGSAVNVSGSNVYFNANFRASGTHKVILNGTAKQTVSFGKPTTSYFQNLEIANTSAEGVVFTSQISVAGSFSSGPQAIFSFSQGVASLGFAISQDQTITGDGTVSSAMDLAGHALTVTGSLTLNAPLVLNGGSLSVGKDMTVNSAFDLEGKTLTVTGKLTIGTDGILYVNGGHCIVGGDLSVSSGAGYLKMVNAADVVEVGGKAAFSGADTYGVDSAQQPYAYLSAGTLKVKGDFTQSGGYTYVSGSNVYFYANFRASGTHKVILNGTAKQTVSFGRPTTSYFQNLEIANTSVEGVVFTSQISVAGSFSSGPQAVFSFSQGVASLGFAISQDQTITGDLTVSAAMDLAGHTLTVTGSLTLNAPLVLNGGSLSVGKDMTVNSAFDLEGKTLTVTGILTIGTNGILYVNGGHCIVGGDLSVSSGAGYLKMVNVADVVEVGGKAAFSGSDTYGVDSAQKPYAYMSAGTLKVKGDFTQSSGYVSVSGSNVYFYANFRASGTHKVILNGTAKQTVSFGYPTTSYFQNLEIANTSAEGVVCTPDKRVTVMDALTITSGKVSGIDHAPRITSLLTNTTWFRDLPNLYQVTADDPDLLDPAFGEKLTFSLDSASTGKGVKITTDGLIYWTPTMAQLGQHTITAIVTDKGGAQARQDLSITVVSPLPESADNDSMVTPTPIVPNKMIKADLTVISGTAKDVDYFKIILAANRHVRVTMITAGSNKYLLDILDSSGTSLGTIHLTGDVNRPVQQSLDLGLTAGTYYLKVLGDMATYTTAQAAQVYGVGYLDLEDFVPPEQTKTVTFGTSYQDVLLNAQDKRYYQFSLDNEGAVSISFTNSTLSDYLFLLKNAAGTVLETFRLPAGLDIQSRINLPAGSYTLAIEPAGYIDASQKFTLTFTSSATDDAIEKEPNDVYTQANPIEVGKIMKGGISGETDMDFYRLSLASTKMLDVIFKTAASAAGHYNLDVLIGETVINHITIPGSGGTSTLMSGLYPGDYFLKVTGTGVNSADGYSIELREATGVDREFEGNNTKAFANGLTPTQVKQARLHSAADIDFFGVSYDAYGYFGITFTPVTQGVPFNVKLYNAEDRLLMDFTAQGSTPVYQDIALWPGSYYVKVTGTGEGDYTLRYDGDGGALKELVKLAIVEAPHRIEVGSATPLKLIGSFTDGSVIDLSTAPATWTSSDAAKAKVNGNIVSAIAAGPATIYSNYSGQMAKVDLDVGATVVVKKQTYGNMILVAGGGSDPADSLFKSTQYLANMTYSRFMARGFQRADISYLNPVPWQDINGDGYGDPVVTDTTPTVDRLRTAIETWAVQQPSTGPLYLVLIDHGGIDTFEIFPGEIISAAELDASLTAFEQATGREMVIYIEACKSGSLVDNLAKGSRRMVITSTNEGNAFLHLDGRISFTQFFMDAVMGGSTFQQSFDRTKLKLAMIGAPYSTMIPQLKAEGQTNTLAATRLGGNFAIAGLFPEILEKTADFTLKVTATAPTFSAKISDLTGATKVWATVTPPTYRVPGVVGNLQAAVVALPFFDLKDEDNGVLDGIYTATYNDFKYNGQYRIGFYARNADGLVSESAPTIVTVTNGLPLPSDTAGDVNGDNAVNLTDAILVLQLLSNQTPAASVYNDADINGGGKIGLTEAIYIMQKAAEMR